MPDAKIGTFDDLLDLTAEALRPVVLRLRDLVREIDPDTIEVVRLGDRAATYGVGPKKMSEGYCYILPHAKWVNFGFYKGADLPDPDGLLTGTGAKMRHVKIHSVDACDAPALAALVRSALAERRAALGLT